MDEKQLINQILSGDSRASHRFASHYGKRVYKLAFHLTSNRQDAEDITQDVMIKAVQSLPQFDGRARLDTWLYRITVNTYLSEQRKPHTNKMTSDEELDARANHEPLPDQLTQNQLIGERIEDAVSSLSPNQRTVFVLKHFKQLKIDEIAEIVQAKPGTIKSHLYRAVEQLRKKLGDLNKIYNREG